MAALVWVLQVWIANLGIALCLLAPLVAAAWAVGAVFRFARSLLREAVSPSAWLGGRGRGRVTRRKQA